MEASGLEVLASKMESLYHILPDLSVTSVSEQMIVAQGVATGCNG